jgi:hypothetical protein
MNTKELYDMAQAANTCANVAVTLGPKCVTIVWHGDRSVHGTTNPNWYGSRHTRELPWSALGDDRDPYRAVREYMKMDAFYMEGIGGIPDRTHDMFQTTAPAGGIKPMRGPKIPPMRPSVTVNVSGFSPNYRRKGDGLKMLPVLEVKPADLYPGDIVETGINAAETVKGVGRLGNDFDVFWVSGGSTRYAATDIVRMIRPGGRRDD